MQIRVRSSLVHTVIHLLLAQFAVLALFGGSAGAKSELILVKDGKPNCLLVIPTKATYAERTCQKILMSHIEQITGHRIPMVVEEELRQVDVEDDRITVTGRRVSFLKRPSRRVYKSCD